MKDYSKLWNEYLLAKAGYFPDETVGAKLSEDTFNEAGGLFKYYKAFTSVKNTPEILRKNVSILMDIKEDEVTQEDIDGVIAVLNDLAFKSKNEDIQKLYQFNKSVKDYKKPVTNKKVIARANKEFDRTTILKGNSNMNEDIKTMIQNVRDNNLQSANDVIKKVMEEKLKEKIKLVVESEETDYGAKRNFKQSKKKTIPELEEIYRKAKLGNDLDAIAIAREALENARDEFADFQKGDMTRGEPYDV